MKTDLETHWDNIFTKTPQEKLGWFEKDYSQTIKLIDKISNEDIKTVFLPGAGTSTLVDYIIKRYDKIILNDLSEKLLELLKSKHIVDSPNTTYLLGDVSKDLAIEEFSVDLWIDRAVLHFLTEEKSITSYFFNVSQKVKAGGFVILAEFSTTGAKKCAGLELHQYSISEMETRIGKHFKLIYSEDYVFINPNGDSRPYIYALFQKEI